MATGWRYYLARSFDMAIIGELRRAHDRGLAVDDNKSGSADCWIPITDDLASGAWPWSRCLIAQHDDSVFWSGPLISRNTDMAAGKVALSAVGWFERLMHLALQQEHMTSGNSRPYVDTDAGAIISDLVTVARTIDPGLPITMGTVIVSQPRTITYSRDQSIGQAIIDLGNIESGVDWYVDPVTRQLNVVPRRGVDQTNVKWTFIEGQKSNLANCVEIVDGADLANEIRPRGKVTSGLADDPASKSIEAGGYGVFQDAPSLSDVIDADILNAYANAEIVYRAQPRVTYQLTPKPSSESSVPRLFRDFDIGDTTYLTARRGFVDVKDQAIRIFGVSLAINDAGTETLSNLQTTAGN